MTNISIESNCPLCIQAFEVSLEDLAVYTRSAILEGREVKHSVHCSRCAEDFEITIQLEMKLSRVSVPDKTL
jgi:uncharacterized metal-binding protein YceD (DUF177 family)